MRKLFVAAFCVASCALLGAQAPPDAPADPQTPTFKTGVDVLAVDVSVTDNRGKPVEDLRPPDFAVRVDGVPRRVVSSELVKIDIERAKRQAADPFDLVFTTNQTPPNGRMIMLAIDQLHVRIGAARSVLQAAGRFVDNLSPADRVGFVAYPVPGPAVDFTDDHFRVKSAMQKVVGTKVSQAERYNIGMSEAVDIALHSDDRVLYLVVNRECRGLRGEALEDCRRDIVVQTTTMTARVREEREESLRALREILAELARIPGPKTLILMAEGLILESPSELNDIVRLASLGRVTVNVLLMDVSSADPSVAVRPPTGREDRLMETSGLGDLAAATRGTLFNVVGSADSIFERIASETSAYYLLGVEESPSDRDGNRHRIDVEVLRRAVTLHSRRAFVLSAAADKKRTPEDALSEVLRSPFAIAELPLRATTFVTQDPASDKVRLMLAAEVGAPGAMPADYTLGFAIFDREGKAVTAFSEHRKLAPTDSRPGAPLEYVTAVLIDPGNYAVRLAVVDGQGRRGSVIHGVSAWQMAGQEFAFGDLFIGNLPDGAERVKPGVEPHIDAGALAAFIELYSTTPAVFGATEVTFEIAANLDEPPITTVAAPLRGDGATWRVAQAALEAAALPPGRYVARAKIARDGKPAGVLSRPFILGTLKPGAAVATGPVSLGTIAQFDRNAVLAPAFVNGVLDTLAARGAGLKTALAQARAGRYGAAALEALTAGDETVAQFLRGLDFYTKGQLDQAATQLNLAAGPRREFFPAGFYLGAAYAAAGRDRDAAGIWQLALTGAPRPAAAYVLFADARFRAGQAESVVDVLKPAHDRSPADDEIGRRLGLAYVMAQRYEDAVPVLDGYLSRNGSDQDVLFAALFSHYETHNRRTTLPSDAERTTLKRYASAYMGPQQALVARYLQSLNVR